MIALINFSEMPVKDDLADIKVFIPAQSIQFMEASAAQRWTGKWWRNLRVVSESVGKELQGKLDAKMPWDKAIGEINAKYVKKGPADDPNKWELIDAIPAGFDDRQR